MANHLRAASMMSLLVGAAATVAMAEATPPADFVLPISSTLVLAQPGEEAAAPEPAAVVIDPFGTSGTCHWSVGAGVAWVSEATDTNIYFTFHTFLATDFEFNLTLGGWYFSQDGDDAAGLNPAFGFRWHFLNRDTWTMYAEVGIGLLFSTDHVPDGGTSVNFTPRAGIGATLDLDGASGGPRLDVGLRWHHISNASSSGADDNPARDSIMLYAGVMFPF